VGVGAGEAGEFAPAHAGVGGGHDEDLVAEPVDARGDLVDLGRGSLWAFGGAPGDDLDAVAGVIGHAAVDDGLAHQ
jgi:hypothetical protein